MTEILVQTKLQALECAGCRMLFAISDVFMQDRRNDHAAFYCPWGHQNIYPAKSEADKLRDELAKKTHEIDQMRATATHYQESRDRVQQEKEHVERRLNATRGVVTRHKRKIAAGRCPCCSQKFKDLARHMATQHLKWDPQKEVEVRAP